MSNKYVSIENYKVSLIGDDGSVLKISENLPVFQVEFTKYQDAVDLIPYFEEGDDVFIIVSENFKPALTLRKDFIEEKDQGSIVIEPVSGVIQRSNKEYGVRDTVKRLFSEKAPDLASAVLGYEHLGGCYFPSPGTSGELVFPISIRINKNINYKHDSSLAKVYPIKASEILDLYFSGKRVFSSRLILLTFRLLDRLGKRVRINNDLVKNFEQFRFSVKSISPDEIVGFNYISYDDVVNRKGKAFGGVKDIKLEKVENPNTNFLFTTNSIVEHEKIRYSVDVIVRKGIDSVDASGVVLKDGEIFISAKWGIRPPILVRENVEHPVSVIVEPFLLEGVAGNVEGSNTKNGIVKIAEKEFQEEFGYESVGESLYLGFDYPSPGHNIERAHKVLLAIDPSKKIQMSGNFDEAIYSGLLNINDAIDLALEGYIRDPRFNLSSYILKMVFNDGVFQGSGDRFDLSQYSEVVKEESGVQKWLDNVASEVDKKLSNSSYYRKLKSYGENELGVITMKLDHEDEAHFFSPMIPLFAMPTVQVNEKLPFYYAHDLFHYATQGFLPIIIGKEGKVELTSFEDYYKGTCGNECEAVWYSDVVIPKEFGINESESIFQGDSVAKVFEEMSISSLESRDMIRSIELDGVIPNKIKEHPLFKRHRGVLIDRILKYHIMDKDNARSMYKYFADHIDTILVMKDFCDIDYNIKSYEERYRNTYLEIYNYSEGVNPIKSFIARVLNQEVRLRALRLAYIKYEAGRIQNDSIITFANKHLDSLKVAYSKLSGFRDSLKDNDPSKVNAQICSYAKSLEKDVFFEVDQFIENLIQNSPLSEHTKKSLKERKVPFFKMFDPIDPDFLKSELAKAKLKNGIDW